MSGIQVKRIGRLMAVFWPLLIIIANTPWLMSLILPPMSELTYDNCLKRDYYLPIVVTGSISVELDKMENEIRFRPTQNGKGCIMFVNARMKKGSYKYALGIA